MSIEMLLEMLEKVSKTGPINYKACCPAHDDNTPSMAVTGTPDGRILVHCYAGCSAVDIMDSLGLSLSDLFPEGAIDNNLKGATPWLSKQRKKERSHKEMAQNILNMAEADRKKGKRQSEKDKAVEKRAFMYLKENPASAQTL